jgi:hypothetical protein
MSEAPYLALHLPFSPLLTDATLKIPPHHIQVCKDTAATRELIATLPIRYALKNAHLSDYYQSRSLYSNPPTHVNLRSPASVLLPSQTLLSVSHRLQPTESNKPLPSLPRAMLIPPHAIISLLDLLDSLHADVASEVSRVAAHIKEAHALIDVYKTERAEECERILTQRERHVQGTKLVDSDFR